MMDVSSRIGVGFGRGLDPDEMVECARLADDLGYESAWVGEGHAGDQFAILGACAVSTARIRLGTSISSVFVRSLPTIAMAAATVDQLSRGRFILGLGTSHREQVEPEHGVVFSRATDRLLDAVEIVRALLRDGTVSHAGRTVSIEAFDLWFATPRKRIPIYIAALFSRSLELCGEIAEGALLIWPTLEAPTNAAACVANGAGRAGRYPQDIDIAAVIPCAIARTRQEALDRMRPVLAHFVGFFPRYARLLADSGFPEQAQAIRRAWERGDRACAVQLVPDAMIDAVAIVGQPDECRERLERYRRAGLRLPIISPRGAGRDPKAETVEAIRLFAPSR